jgi:hypothetical protein
MAHRQSFNRTDRPTDRCGDHSDGCRNRLRRYNFQPRPYPSLQRSCALRRVARCSLLGSKTIRRPSGPQRNPLKSLVDEEGFQSSFSGRRTKPQGAGIISGLATIPRNDLIQHSECYGGLTRCKPFFGNTCPHLVAVPFDPGESSGQQFGRAFSCCRVASSKGSESPGDSGLYLGFMGFGGRKSYRALQVLLLRNEVQFLGCRTWGP